MRLIEKITGIAGDLDAELEAEAARKEAAAKDLRWAAATAPVSANVADAAVFGAAEKRATFAVNLTPSVRGLVINTSHPLESTVEEVGGRITISLKW